MNRPSASKDGEVLRRAEQRVLRAAAGCVTAEGSAFGWYARLPVVHFPDSIRRLESAIANLRSVRRFQSNKRRKARGK